MQNLPKYISGRLRNAEDFFRLKGLPSFDALCRVFLHLWASIATRRPHYVEHGIGPRFLPFLILLPVGFRKMRR